MKCPTNIYMCTQTKWISFKEKVCLSPRKIYIFIVSRFITRELTTAYIIAPFSIFQYRVDGLAYSI